MAKGLGKKLRREITSWIEGILALLPYSRTGNTLRRVYWSKRLGIASGNITIFPGVHFFCPEALSIGDGVCLNYHVLIDPCDGFISIGNNVLIGPNCVLRAADHNFSDLTRPIRSQGHIGGRITIEDDCWLGANVVVLRNVTIGRGSVIAAGAVVNRDIPPLSIATGVPARLVATRRQQTGEPGEGV